MSQQSGPGADDAPTSEGPAEVHEGEPLEVPDGTMAAWWRERVAAASDDPAALVREGDEFTERPYATLHEDARQVAGGLLDAGLEPGDRLAVRADTCYRWSVVDLACHLAGVVVVPVYPSFPPERAAHVVADADADVLVAADDQPATVADAVESVLTLADLPRRDPDEGELAGEERGPTDAATLVYTSGTTGAPKGCVLTHRNLRATLAQLRAHFPPSGDVATAFLPLSHVYQRLGNYHAWDRGSAVAYMDPDALDEELPMVRPTAITAVPRLYERLHDAIRGRAAEMATPKRQLFEWALDVAGAYGAALADAGDPSATLRARHAVADRLVLSTLREQLGLDRVRHSITGAASIDPEVLTLFWGAGVPLLEGYGATELTTPGALMPPDRFRPGTVGVPAPGIAIGLADDGEVLVAGPNVMREYHGRPDATDEAFLEAGDRRWYRTGDVGAFDDAGYLRIVDRKASMAVLDTGKNVAPARVETALKRHRTVAEAMAVADGRKFVVALVQPDYDAALRLAREAGVTVAESAVEREDGEVVAVPRAVVDSDPVRDRLADAVAAANEGLADHEQVGRFDVLERALSVEAGELTPTLKKRRETVAERYADRIEAMYDG
jgi:long-chain acyl-CoA synthetase